MKKTLLITILTIAVLMLTVGGVYASSSTLGDDLYAKLSVYGMTSGDKVRVERFVKENNVTDEQASSILAKADEAVAIMKAANVTDVKELSKSDLEKVEKIAQEAASVVGATVTYKNNTAEVYKDGKLVATVVHSNGKLVYTGNQNYLVVFSVIAIALVVAGLTIVTKRNLAK